MDKKAMNKKLTWKERDSTWKAWFYVGIFQGGLLLIGGLVWLLSSLD